MSEARLIAGAMTGTSIDGIDVALARIEGSGVAMTVHLVRHEYRALDHLAAPLRRLADGAPADAATIARLALDLGLLHAAAIDDLRGDTSLDLVAVHGQTVFHDPPLTWQLINPAPIAARLQCPVVFDLRQADLAAGGQGAPITPLADWVLLRAPDRRRAVVNLGGFCNVTILPAGDDPGGRSAIRGMDVCVCNQLLDAVARVALGRPFDDAGAAAARGRADDVACSTLRSILEVQRAEHRALGSGDEALDWAAAHTARLAPDDLAASATRSIAGVIGDAVSAAGVDEVILAGGGARHLVLSREIVAASGARPVDGATLGVPAAAREALCMAVLGALCADGVAITLAQVTGRDARLPSGSWTGPPPQRA